MLPVTGSSLPVSVRPALFPDLQFSLHSRPQVPFTGCRDRVRDRPTRQRKGSRKAHGFTVLLTKGLAGPHPLAFHPEGGIWRVAAACRVSARGLDSTPIPRHLMEANLLSPPDSRPGSIHLSVSRVLDQAWGQPSEIPSSPGARPSQPLLCLRPLGAGS